MKSSIGVLPSTASRWYAYLPATAPQGVPGRAPACSTVPTVLPMSPMLPMFPMLLSACHCVMWMTLSA